MIQSTRIFRVFVSSTFSDLKAERNALQEKVFPRLKELCTQHGCRFQAIDLRWGVSEEAALDQQAMKICLGEVARCQELSPRPNFIVLLGDRYGWQPAPYEIPAEEYDAIIPHTEREEKDLLSKWYRRDDNAVHPVYDIQPREGMYEDFNHWEPVEKKILSILRRGVEKLNLDEDARIKYISSATEQEIYKGALNAPDAREHVFCFLRSIQNLPLDQTAKDFIDLDEDGKQDKESHQRLLSLKKRLLKELPGNVHEYTNCNWTGNGITTDHLDKLCEDAYAELSGVITQEISTLKKVEPLEQEISAHAAFTEEISRNFIGREEIIKKILAYVQDESKAPLAIFGQGGSGKSALMAHVCERIAEENLDAIVISRFIGATPASTNIYSLLESLCRQMARAYGKAEDNIPTEFKELVEYFKNKLATSSKEKPLVLLLDALDQLSDAENAKLLMWLPYDLPENVKIIVSALEPSLCFDQLKRRYSEDQIVTVGLMEPKEGNNLLDLWLSESKRTLEEKQRMHLLERYKGCSLPLYMKLAFEEARTWKSYDVEKAQISGRDISGVIREFLENLSAESRHGETILKHTVGYLAAAKNGLTEEEMLDLLSLDEDVKDAFWKKSPNSPKTDRLPVVVWSRMYLDLKPYLTERQANQTVVMNYFHRAFSEVVRNSFLNDTQMKQLHRHIATYFKSQPYEYQSKEGKLPNYRKVSEIAYQMMQNDMWSELQNTITDFDYPMTKCKAEMLDELIDDYQNAAQKTTADNKTLLIWAAFITRHAINLRRGNAEWPSYKIMLQIALDHAEESPVTIAAEKWCAETTDHFPFFRKLNRRQKLMPGYKLMAIDYSLRCMALHPDGCRLITGSEDCTVKVWDLKLGTCLATMEGHFGEVKEVLLHPDGRRVISGSADKTIRVWDIDSGKCLSTMEGHRGEVWDTLLHPDGRRAISGSADKTIRVWDIDSGKCISLLEGHCGEVSCILLHPDGQRIISGSADKTIRVWDIDRGHCLSTLKGHKDMIDIVLLYPDGQRLVSASPDETLRQWNIVSGKCIDTYYYVIDGNGCSFMYLHPDEDKIIVGDYFDTDIKILNIETFESIHTLEGHGSYISCAKLYRGSSKLVTSTWKGDIELWDVDNGKCIKSIRNDDLFFFNQIETYPDGSKVIIGGIKIEVFDVAFGTVENDSDRDLGKVTDLQIYKDGSMFLSCSEGGTVRFWDSTSGNCKVKLSDLYFASVNCFQIHPNGREIFTGGEKCAVIASDLETGEFQYNLGFLRNMDKITNMAISADGQIVVTGHLNGNFCIWDVNTISLLSILSGHEETVTTVAFLPDGKRAISGSFDNTLRIWNINTGECIAILEGHANGVTAVAVHPDGRRFLSSSIDGTLKIWNLNTYECLKTLPLNETAAVTLAVLPDGERVVTGNWDMSLNLWDIETGKCLSTLKGHKRYVYKVAIHPDGCRVLSCSPDRTVKIWHLGTKKCIFTLKGHQSNVMGLAVHPDGHTAASCDTDGNLKIWDVDSGKCLKDIYVHVIIKSLVFHPDGRKIILAGEDSVITIWDIETGNCYAAPEGHISEITHIIIHPDGRRLISASAYGVKVWDIETKQCLLTFVGHEGDIEELVLLPDGCNVVSGCCDNKIRILNIETGECKRTIETEFKSMIVSTDGRSLISSGSDNVLRIWDLETGLLLKKLIGHETDVFVLAMHPDRESLISGSNNGILKVWNINTGECIVTRKLHDGGICFIEISPDGKFVVTGGVDLRIKLWYLPNMNLTASYHMEAIPQRCKFAENGNIAYNDENDNVGILQLINKPSGFNKAFLLKTHDNPIVANEVASTYNSLGCLLNNQGKNEEAVELFRDTVGIREAIYEKNQNNCEMAYKLVNAYNYLGIQLKNISNSKEAMTYYEKAIELCKGVLLTSPDNFSMVDGLADSHNNIGVIFDNAGDSDNAIFYYKKAIGLREPFYIRNHNDPDVVSGLASNYLNLCGLLQNLDKNEEAMELYEKAVGICARIHKKFSGRLDIADKLARLFIDLSALLQKLNDYDKAVIYYKKAIKIREGIRKRTPEDANINKLLSENYLNLGLFFIEMGKAEEGLSMLQQAGNLEEEMIDSDYHRLADIQNRIGLIHWQRNELDEAISCHQKALEIRKEFLGLEHPDTAISLYHLGLVLFDKGDIDHAESVYRQALEIWDRTHDTNTIDKAYMLSRLGILQENKGDLATAEELYRKAIIISEEILGKQHNETAGMLYRLAIVLWNKRELAECELLYRRVLAIREVTLGKDHPYTINTRNELANLVFSKGNFDEAEDLYKQVFSILEEKDGHDHFETATAQHSIGVTRWEKGDIESAEMFFSRALDVRLRILGTNHPDTIASMSWVARVAENKEDYKTAETLYIKALKSSKKSSNGDSVDTASIYYHLARLCHKEGKRKKAEMNISNAIGIMEKVMGKEHDDTLTCKKLLQEILESRGNKS